jgi:hypothetical protein
MDLSAPAQPTKAKVKQPTAMFNIKHLLVFCFSMGDSSRCYSKLTF